MYVSPVDLLGISLDELMGLDDKNLIRLEKILDAKFALGATQGYNQQELNRILDQLNDPETKKAVFFVEQHPLLKKFIIDGTHSHVKTFSIDKELLAATPGVDDFLKPYFEQYLFPFIKQELQKKRYDIILRAMDNKELFSPLFLDKYYRLIIDRLDYMIETIKTVAPGKLYRGIPEITYGTFVDLLNTVPIGLIRKAKIDYINAMVDYYNMTKSTYPEFSVIRRAFANMGRLYFDDFEMRRFVKKLASQINAAEIINNKDPEKEQKYVGKAIWLVVVLVFAFFKFLKILDQPQNSTSNNQKNDIEYILKDVEGEEQKRLLENYLRKQYYRDAQKTDFFEQLLKSSQSAKNYGIELVPVLPNRSNPYPDYFYDFPKFPKTDQRSRFYNRQEMPVILFKLNKWRGDDKAGFFKQNSSLEIDVAKGDSLVFYMGEIFSKLSNINTTVANDSSKLVIDKMFKFSTKKEHELLRTFYVVDSIGKDSHILVSSSGIKFQGLKLRVVE